MTNQTEIAKARAAYKAAKDSMDRLDERGALMFAHAPFGAFDKICIKAAKELEEASRAYDKIVSESLKNL